MGSPRLELWSKDDLEKEQTKELVTWQSILSTDERCRSGSGEKDIVSRSELILTTTTTTTKCNTNERLSTRSFRKSICSLSIRLEEQKMIIGYRWTWDVPILDYKSLCKVKGNDGVHRMLRYDKMVAGWALKLQEWKNWRGRGGCDIRKMTQNEVIRHVNKNLSLPTKEQPVRSQIEMHR